MPSIRVYAPFAFHPSHSNLKLFTLHFYLLDLAFFSSVFLKSLTNTEIPVQMKTYFQVLNPIHASGTLRNGFSFKNISFFLLLFFALQTPSPHDFILTVMLYARLLPLLLLLYLVFKRQGNYRTLRMYV